MLFTFSFMTAWFAIMFWTYEIRSSKWSSIMKLTVKPADWWSTNTGWCRSISCEEVSCCFLLYMLLYCIFQVLRFYYFEKSFYSISSEFNRYFCILGKGFTQVTDKRGYAFPMVIWPAFRMGPYRVNDHPSHAPQFTGNLLTVPVQWIKKMKP